MCHCVSALRRVGWNCLLSFAYCGQVRASNCCSWRIVLKIKKNLFFLLLIFVSLSEPCLETWLAQSMQIRYLSLMKEDQSSSACIQLRSNDASQLQEPLQTRNRHGQPWQKTTKKRKRSTIERTQKKTPPPKTKTKNKKKNVCFPRSHIARRQQHSHHSVIEATNSSSSIQNSTIRRRGLRPKQVIQMTTDFLEPATSLEHELKHICFFPLTRWPADQKRDSWSCPLFELDALLARSIASPKRIQKQVFAASSPLHHHPPTFKKE